MSKTVYNLIIVDMSGSMYYIRQQAFDGLNDTILTIRKMQEERPDIEQRISLITFNSLRKRFVYDNVPAAQCRRMKESEAATCSSPSLPMGRRTAAASLPSA